jgi:hypothetical protein
MFESSASIAMMKHSKGRRARRAVFGRFYGVVRPSRAMPASPELQTRAAKNGASEDLPKRATPACAAQ